MADTTVDDVSWNTLQALRAPRRSTRRDAIGTLVTVAAFAIRWGRPTALSIGILANVLALHEAGHWLGMRFFKSRDPSIFMFPMLGGTVDGDPEAIASWKRGVVILLGPLPGLLLAFVTAVAYRSSGAEWLKTATMTLALVNAWFLLPFLWLDGRALVAAVLSGRSFWIEWVVALLGTVGLAVAGLALREVFLGVIGFIGIIASAHSYRTLRVAAAARSQDGDLPQRIRDASDEQLVALIRRVRREAFPPGSNIHRANSLSNTELDALVQTLRDVYTRAVSRSTDWKALVGFGFAYTGGFVVAVVAVVVAQWSMSVAGRMEPLAERKPLVYGALVAHYPSSFRLSIGVESAKLERSLGTGVETVFLVAKSKEPGMEFATAAQRIADELGLRVETHEGECRGLRGLAARGTRTGTVAPSIVEGCFAETRERTVFVGYAVAPAIEALERGQLKAIVEGTEVAP